MLLENATVISQSKLGKDYWLLKLLSPSITKEVKPGQFVHLRVPALAAGALRRPFTIFKAENNSITILYQSVGLGTQSMTLLQPDEKVSLLGPLGNGFPPLKKSGSFPVLIAGGYGIAALYLLAQSSPSQGIIFIGGKSACDILCPEDFKQLGWDVRIATEDGSLGTPGMVTGILDTWIRQEAGDYQSELFACGPDTMLKAIGECAKINGWTAWLCLERHMGCGIGACLGCAQKIYVHPSTEKDRQAVKRDKNIKERNTSWRWARVCKEGPVFECREICWEDYE